MQVNNVTDVSTNYTSSINTPVNRTERPAAPTRPAGDNGFETNQKPSTYQTQTAEAAKTMETSTRQESKSEGVKTNVYTRDQVTQMRSNREVQQLKSAEQSVITHEQAHMSVGGPYAGNATYEYTEGPDGQRYITGGEVSINAPAGKDAEETARIMNQVKRAALAPANPSSQDIKVAQHAAAQEQAALRQQTIDESLASAQTVRQERKDNLDVKAEAAQETDNSNRPSTQDVISEQRTARLNRQAMRAEKQVAAEERNLDALDVEKQAVRQDYERKVSEYQRIMQQVNVQKSSINPSAKAVDMVA